MASATKRRRREQHWPNGVNATAVRTGRRQAVRWLAAGWRAAAPPVLAGAWLSLPSGCVTTPATPPGADATAAERGRWVQQHVTLQGYVVAAIAPNRVTLIAPASLARRADGHVTGTFRTELFAPRTVGTATVRSVRKHLEVDCGALRYRELQVEGFAAPNLRQPITGVPLSAEWTASLAADSDAGQALRLACSRAPAQNP